MIEALGCLLALAGAVAVPIACAALVVALCERGRDC